MEMIFLWIFLFVIFDALGTVASFTGPLNVATVAGSEVLFRCSTGSGSRLRWSTKPSGRHGDQQILTRDNRILPNFESQYFVESTNGQFNLGIRSASSSLAGRYICLELSTSNTTSAELIVLDPKPVCKITHHPLDVECDVSYKGAIIPAFELKLQTVDTDDHKGCHLIRRLTLGADAIHSLNLSCVASFNETGTKSAKLSPENENGVTGTVAGNTPNLVSVTECSQPPVSSAIARAQHFGLLAIATSLNLLHCLSLFEFLRSSLHSSCSS